MNQEGFKNAYHRLISLFENISSNSSTYDELIKYFYEIGKDYGQPEFNIQILEISIEDKKQLLKELIKEIINLDFCYYISTGVNPKLGIK